jgi:PAS domain S-box-containing protein
LEQIANNGRVLEIQMTTMPGGGIVTTYTDITERKASEWALRDSEQRIRLITDAVPALIAYVDSSQRYRFTNSPFEEWFGRPRSEINGRLMSAVLGPELYDARRDAIEAALAGQHVTFEMSLPLVKGSIECALATYEPHFGPDGEVLGFFALIQDITERKRAAEQLREAKEGLERRVVERTAELTALNAQLKQEVEDRRQAEAALLVAKGEAERANMSKTKFIAAASHDLLQPLNAARVFAAALSESRMAERNRGLVANVCQALNSVDDLLSAVLDISKLDAGGQRPGLSDVPIDALLTSLVAEYMPQTKVRNLSLRKVTCTAVVRTDPILVSRILRNFLSNAMRYTPSGRILLGARRRRDGLEVQVWDSGIGIPDDKRHEIFDEFRRLADDSHGNDRGMGLGLAIVERIARCLNHPIGVRSTLGRGSMFSVTLPFGNAPYRAEPPDAGLILPTRADGIAGTCVVVVENDPAALEGMRALLQSWQCTVVTTNGRAGTLAQLRALNRRPDVLLADYHLDNGQTGLQALADIQDLYAPPLPGIVITADRTDDIQSQIREAGYHLLNKPLKPARLRSLLAHLTQSEQEGRSDTRSA